MTSPPPTDPHLAVIFDLDGVLVSTDDMHYRGWKQLADEIGASFDRERNERCRGVSRMESLAVVLEGTDRQYTDEQKVELADRKNTYYRAMLEDLTPSDTLPGARATLIGLRERGVKTAIASASRNAPVIIERIGISELVDALVDGNQTTRSKPDPQVFLLAAEKLDVPPERCVVVEDAAAGVEAAKRAGMAVLGIGEPHALPEAPVTVPDLAAVTLDQLLVTPHPAS